MKILVTGKEGQLARALLALSGADGGVSVTALGRPALDLTNRDSVIRAIEAERPDILVNAAAYTAVDQAEKDVDMAFAVNRDGAGHAAFAAHEAGIPIIHISTDYVFAGDKPVPYSESDPTGPTGIYGHSKLEGEIAVAEANPAHAILRTAWVYSPYGNNFLKTMLRLAQDRDVVRVVADQHGTPTYAPDIADGIIAAARTILADPDGDKWRGVFHMVAEGETNWAGFAQEIFARSAEAGGPSARVEPIPASEYPTLAKRPANSRLATTRFSTAYDHSLPHWQDGVRRCVNELLQSKI